MGLMAANSDQKESSWKSATLSLGTYKVACSAPNPSSNPSSSGTRICAGSVWNKMSSSRFLHPSNAENPIFVTEFGIVTLVSASHPSNAENPISVTEFGIVTLVSTSHQLNASSPIFVTDSGMLILVSASHPLNAYFPISVTEFGIVTLVSALHS